MLPQFDDIAGRTFHHVLDIMGEDAFWLSSGGETVSGRVLFAYPTEPYKIAQAESYEYIPVHPTAEYYKDTFGGMKDASDKQFNEFLRIRGAKYFVTSVEKIYDGDTFIANLELAEE